MRRYESWLFWHASLTAILPTTSPASRLSCRGTRQAPIGSGPPPRNWPLPTWAPLPEGDAGLIAAVSRWCELEPMHSFESRGFSYTLEDEREIITPISTAAEHEFENRIEAWPVQGLAGAAAKLRYLFENRESIDIEDIEGRQ